MEKIPLYKNFSVPQFIGVDCFAREVREINALSHRLFLRKIFLGPLPKQSTPINCGTEKFI